MSKILVVVESPEKAKKIGHMLGDGYVVQASGGHIRDLPVKAGENGYDANTLEPVYEVTDRGAVSVKYLKSAMKGCNEVLLATDPDREGEAIGWHVAEVLGVKKRMRVMFHEITESAVMAAINEPSPLNVNLVRAQEARRVIDRMVGWLISSPLSRAIGEKASAGRVQSPSLGLVVEREREIKAFVKEQYFGSMLTFSGVSDWTADWIVPGGEGVKCKVKNDAERAAAVRSLIVQEYIERDEFESPPSLFDTALLQQAASVALGFDPEKTMKEAQALYQVHGFITYHRTDELNISDDGYAMIVAFAQDHGLPVVESKRRWKGVAGAQEAHEAIRPTNFEADVSVLNADELALYQLIHRRAVASQLTDVVHSVRRVVLEGDDLKFSAVGRVLKDHGWRAFGVTAESEDEVESKTNAVPELSVGDTLSAIDGKVVESWTRAPKRYTKASLVETLKALGIGRPATYAPAVDGLQKREYVALEKRFLVPKPVAEKIYDALNGKFAFIKVDFTRGLEESLDAITQGRLGYSEVVRGMFNVLQGELAALVSAAAPVKREAVAGVVCPKCGKGMVERKGPKGKFYGCTGYPDCKGTKQI